MEKFFVVEDCNSGELTGYRSIQEVRDCFITMYMENMADWYKNFDGSNDQLIKLIQEDLRNIFIGYPYIEDFAYTRDVTIN